MKKVFALFLVMLLTSTIISADADTIEKETGFVSVNFSMTKEISPNQAEITVKIETSDKSLQKASEENKAIAKQVYASLKALISPNDYIKTSNYSAHPQYIYTKDNKRVLDKYVVSNTVIVKTKNTDLVSKIIDTAIAKGATNVENLIFSSSDYDSSCNTALAELTKKASTQANAIANSINAKITGIKSINASCNSDNGPRPYLMMAKAVGDSATESTPIESGKVKINVNIDASFYVK